MPSQKCLRCQTALDPNYRACPHCGEPVTDFQRRYSTELLDGKYRILERLGAGGMGDVYKAEHTYLGSMRVIKVIRPQISESQDAHDRFLREARASTKVQHPNVATLHDFSGLADGSHYMVWEYIDGENLAQKLRSRGTLPPRTAAHIAIQALHGLEAIHRAGIIHRDISPENLMIAADDVVKIIDLGVAKVSDPSEVAATRTGIFIGKLRYASPEHLGFLGDGERIDGRADLYSLAMVLYEMLAGRPPFEAKSPHEYFMLHSRETQFRPLELPADLPGGAELQDVLSHALERDRTKRFATARDFAVALEEVERVLPDPRSMKTMALPFDGDATIRVTPSPDTLHRSTARSELRTLAATPLPAVATPPPSSTPPPQLAPSQPPRPPQFQAPPTLQTSVPQARRQRQSAVPFVIIALVLIAAAVAIVWLLLRQNSQPPVASSTIQAPRSTAAAPATTTTQESQSTLDVVSDSTTSTATPATTTTTATIAPATSSAPPATATSAPPRPQPKPVVTETRAQEPQYEQPAPAPAPVPSGGGRAYVDGGGDDDANEAAMSSAQSALAGVKRVAIRGGMARELIAALKEDVPHLDVVDGGAEATINIDGTFERLGRGRKVREAHVTIVKNGRVVFRYELPREEYRAGMHPAAAFARIASDLFAE